MDLEERIGILSGGLDAARGDMVSLQQEIKQLKLTVEALTHGQRILANAISANAALANDAHAAMISASN